LTPGAPPAPPDAPALFGPPEGGEPSGGPCLVDPEDQALFPSNWLPPRFRFVPVAGQNLFEIRVHTDSEPSDLVVYTAHTSWTMPAAMWSAAANALTDKTLTVTVRGAVFDGMKLVSPPSMGSKVTVSIAPVSAAGNVVYWTTGAGSALKGFAVGSTSVVPVLTPGQVEMPTSGGAAVTCVGCHTSTPDGLYASFTAQGPWANAIASIDAASVGKKPPFLGAGAEAALSQPEMGIHTYSKAHWAPGDRIKVAPLGNYANSRLIWLDLEAQSPAEGAAFGTIPRSGDPRGVGAPTWSHDGNTIVYVSTNAQTTGRLDNGEADLYAVPYNNKAGGVAAPIPGASDPALAEYYPAFSPDDKYLIFNRVPNGNNMYNQALTEVFVIPSGGGSAARLLANDPPACAGKTSPGVTNSWAKWSPEATSKGGRTYYWIIFSSARSAKGNPQLYLTALVEEAGSLTTHGALHFWNQPEDENNHTPAWDVFQIPVPQ
jgi:mono/diheme cytochrome c family protein